MRGIAERADAAYQHVVQPTPDQGNRRLAVAWTGEQPRQHLRACQRIVIDEVVEADGWHPLVRGRGNRVRRTVPLVDAESSVVHGFPVPDRCLHIAAWAAGVSLAVVQPHLE